MSDPDIYRPMVSTGPRNLNERSGQGIGWLSNAEQSTNALIEALGGAVWLARFYRLLMTANENAQADISLRSKMGVVEARLSVYV